MKWGSKPLWLRKMMLCLALVMGIGGVWSGYVWYHIEKTIQEAVPRHADVGIVLGAAVWGTGPSPGLRERLDKALSLYEQGYFPYVIVSGGLGKGKQVTEAAVMQKYLVDHGVPSDRILLETQATSTNENLLYSQQVMVSNNMKNALIISHDYHLARAMAMAETLGIEGSPVGVTSHVLFGPYHKSREVLAFTYWRFERFFSSAFNSTILA